MKQIIFNKLYQCEKLSKVESYTLFNYIISNKLQPIELATALIAMKVRGEYPEEIAGAASALLQESKHFPSPNYIFADIAGTGGDGTDSINISTPSAFVAAACGLKVAKHTNRSSCGNCGSSDLLEALGVNLNMTPEQSRKALDDYNLCFLFAPYYYSCFTKIIPIRKQLRTSTIFNIIGPLINPSHPVLAVIGVYKKNLVLPIAKTLQFLNYKHGIVVHSGGMDKVTLYSPTQVAELKQGKIDTYELIPKDFGLNFFYNKEMIHSGTTPQQNSIIIKRILQGKGHLVQEYTIAVNVALLMKVFGNENIRDNTHHAISVIRSGKAYEKVVALAMRQ